MILSKIFSTVVSRVFPVAAARIWNVLQESVVEASSVDSFRRQLFRFGDLYVVSTFVDLAVNIYLGRYVKSCGFILIDFKNFDLYLT